LNGVQFCDCSCSCVYCDFEFLKFVFSTLRSRSCFINSTNYFLSTWGAYGALLWISIPSNVYVYIISKLYIYNFQKVFFSCDMTYSFVGHDSCICVWQCKKVFVYLCETWLILVGPCLFIRVTLLILTSEQSVKVSIVLLETTFNRLKFYSLKHLDRNIYRLTSRCPIVTVQDMFSQWVCTKTDKLRWA